MNWTRILARIGAAVLLANASGGCAISRVRVDVGTELDASNGAVACVDPIAAEVGARVLARGGNAVDATVATAFALAVTWPAAGNIGGGGFLLYRAANGDASFVDYREIAPARATPTMFLDEHGAIDRYHVDLGFRPVGVPGTVAGLWLAHERFGALPWRELLEPAVRLAADGFVVSPALHDSIAGERDDLARFPESARIFLDEHGGALPAGARLRQPDLARSLARIAEDGPDAFYRGEIAARIVADSDAHGGLLALSDFAAYRAVERAPLVGRYRGRTIVCGPPPTAGGTFLLETLGQLAAFDLHAIDPDDDAELHLISEAMRRSFLDRALHLGDPDFVQDPVEWMTSPAHVDELARSIDRVRATKSDAIAGDLGGTLAPPESEQTTHISVVDRFGNAVANTYTLEDSWGAKVVAAGTGIVMNNEMHDFVVTPGKSDRDGAIGTAPNVIAPGKRMLSSMCPTIVVGADGALELVLGSPGGRTIPSTVIRVLTAEIDHGLAPRAAVDLGRLHQALYPDRLRLERRVDRGVRDRLAARGHAIEDVREQGDCHAILRDPATGRLVAVADRRIAGGVAAPAR